MTELESVLEHMIAGLVGAGIGASEGVVRSYAERPPYRRVDVGPRTLAYLRVRAKRGGVRVDVSNLWRVPSLAGFRSLCERSSTGVTMLVRNTAEADLAIAMIRAAVERETERA